MAHKQMLFHGPAREKILRGASQLADAVRVTLGPKSKSVLIQRAWGAPLVCNDGVTIAKEISLKDPEEDLGAQVLRQAAEKTGEAVGDGTSTATILAQAILADGVRNVVAGASAVEIKRGLAPGGGLALIRCIPAVEKVEAQSEGDVRTGVQILKRALEAPARQIAENSAVDGGVVVARMRESEGNFGFDAARNTYLDLVEAGIIDPAKVIRVALENAVSVASMLLLTEATMTDIPEPRAERALEADLS